MFQEFKKFALKGSVMDLAIGVIIGTAFGKIVSSLVEDIIMPPIGLLLGKVDFSSLFIDLSGHTYASLSEAKKAGAPTINYGLFINNVLNFLIVAWVIFLVIKQINRLRGVDPFADKSIRECPYCAMAISPKAKRCPCCTSDLSAAQPRPA